MRIRFVPTRLLRIGKWIDEAARQVTTCFEVATSLLKTRVLRTPAAFPFHEDGKTVVKERIPLPFDKANPNILHDDITTIDMR